ncbi:hypothetical protein EK21DRAFT_100055 [Setomelanomma holmii]|uniref:GST N-terminal domain-containing protein n=1 Tax=Setomelanomma holmii TaxID=210430 RepID=A0A9P4HA86_9PLEO|nr:hypothetical protein EK21DRAFT_100055 [Setomelanomma holmii]
MAPQTVPNDIILYNYGFSPFGKRVSAYLALRGINYALCEQPFTMPRPDLALLPVHYRRIPILAIGRDIYLDTRLILRVLESLPDISPQRLGAIKPQDVFVEKLLERYMIEGPVFGQAAGLVPVDVAQDPNFNKDRQGMLGRNWSKEELDEGRGECLTYVRNLFNLFESTILADGRDWILGSEGPKLADIEGIFMLDFVTGLQLPENLISAKTFPRTFAWLDRYQAAVEKAKKSGPEPTALDGQAAADHIHRSEFGRAKVSVDGEDPTGLRDGANVEIFTADWVTEHKDRGRLVGLTADEVTIAVTSKENAVIRVHAPRTGFKIKGI